MQTHNTIYLSNPLLVTQIYILWEICESLMHIGGCVEEQAQTAGMDYWRRWSSLPVISTQFKVLAVKSNDKRLKERPHQAGYQASERHSDYIAARAAKSQRPPVNAIAEKGPGAGISEEFARYFRLGYRASHANAIAQISFLWTYSTMSARVLKLLSIHQYYSST